MLCVYTVPVSFVLLMPPVEIHQALIPAPASMFWLDEFPFYLPPVSSDSSDDDSQVEDNLVGKNTSKSEPCKTILPANYVPHATHGHPSPVRL